MDEPLKVAATRKILTLSQRGGEPGIGGTCWAKRGKVRHLGRWGTTVLLHTSEGRKILLGKARKNNYVLFVSLMLLVYFKRRFWLRQFRQRPFLCLKSISLLRCFLVFIPHLRLL